MATSMNIFKASALVQANKAIAPSIETEDWIHVCKIEEPARKSTILISYVWDTREIISMGEYDNEDKSIKALNKAIKADNDNALLADDNLCPLKNNQEQWERFSDYIDFANHEIFTARPFINVKTVVEHYKNDAWTKCYMIGDECICTTDSHTDMFCSVDKKNGRPSRIRDTQGKAKSTEWHTRSLNAIFGYRPEAWFYQNGMTNYRYNLSWGDHGHAMSRKDIKLAVATAYNCRTTKFSEVDMSQGSED